MASSTRYYNLGFFDFGDDLRSDYSAQIEIDRFVLIDKQIYGLFSIFGNGVINGWTVTTSGTFEISVSEGWGNINFISGRTEFPEVISDIPPNSINYVYAKLRNRTLFSEDIEFVLTQDGSITDPNFLLLAEVVTNGTTVSTINNNVRQEIGFLELIKDVIKNHKHRGGSLHPSKIDLQSEVTGQLPSFRIADLDTEKITSGVLDLGRLPIINHQDLDNVGILTHPQLDTFVKTLEVNNKELFGEIGSSVAIQLILSMKYIYDDVDSPFYFSPRTVDKYMSNLLTVIPGITPENRIDTANSTANISTVEKFIGGIVPSSGTSFYVTYNTDSAWNSASSKENVIIVSDTVSLAFTEDNDSILTIENFESATTSNQSLTGTSSTVKLFDKQTVVVSDSADIYANTTALDVLEGFFSGKFSHKQNVRVQYVKNFNEVQDWSGYNSFVTNVKCLDSIHGSVKVYFFDADGKKSVDFTILDEDEVTENDDLLANNFESRIVSVSQISFRSKVKGFVIYSDDTTSEFSFLIDYITLQKDVALPEDGKIVLRYSTSNQVVFSVLQWTSTEPDGTSINVRARAANGSVFLSRQNYTSYLNNGDLVNLHGTDLEIEINLTSDTTRILSPILSEFRILILSPADMDGFTINSETEFARGSTNNININTDPVSLDLNTPIYVDSYYYALSDAINQFYNGGESFTSELGLFGTNSPISPNLIFYEVEQKGALAKINNSRLFEPRSVSRTNDRSFVIADTYNDRVLEMNEDGDLLSGIGSINYEHDSKTFPLSACVDIRTGILYIVWSRTVNFKTVDVEQIIIQNASQSTQLQLVENSDKILGLTTEELSEIDTESQILPISLSANNLTSCINLTSNNCFLIMSNSVLSTGIDLSSVYYKTVKATTGLPVYVGNFAYIDGIHCPTYVQKRDDNFIITNSTIAITDFLSPTSVSETITKNSNASSVIEINSDNEIIYSYNEVKFSPFIPGRAERIDNSSLIVGGLSKLGELKENPDFNFRNISGDKTSRNNKKQILNDMFFGGTTPFTGIFVLVDSKTNATTFEYSSPEGLLVSDVEFDSSFGNFIIAESSFKNSGRIIKVDNFGNIIFVYGEGLYNLINDIKLQIDNSIVISS